MAGTTDSKPFWQSKTFWGLVATGLGVLLPMFHVTASAEDVNTLVNSASGLVDAVVTFGGLAFAMYGRVVATKSLSASPADTSTSKKASR